MLNLGKASTQKDSKYHLELGHPFDQNDYNEEPTGLAKARTFGVPETPKSEDTSYTYKKAGGFIEYGDDIQPDLHKSSLIKFHDPPAVEETDEEDNVYPLSIKYDKRKALKTTILR